MSDDSVYEGDFKNNEFDGHGEYKGKNYNYYGAYSSGKKHGKGKMENLIDNSEYEGEFKNDEKDGYGIEKYMDGSLYRGMFKHNMKDGRGILILEDQKSFYDGEFKNDKMSGKGKFKFDEKKEYIGEWQDNEISGYGILSDKNIIHVGYFLHDMKEGYGASFRCDQSLCILGKWKDDLLSGTSILIPGTNGENNFDYEGNVKYMNMNEDKIVQIIDDEELIKKFKSSKEYSDMIEKYKNNFYQDFIQFFPSNQVNDNNNN